MSREKINPQRAVEALLAVILGTLVLLVVFGVIGCHMHLHVGGTYYGGTRTPDAAEVARRAFERMDDVSDNGRATTPKLRGNSGSK